jgi:uncharacterized protein
MTFRIALTLIVGGLIGSVAGCKKSDPAPPGLATNVPAEHHLYMDHAQPKLQTIQLWLGAQALDTEIAATDTQIYTGMMYRTNMAENEAMLFVFKDASPRSFYMRNTLVPLSCAYIDPQGTILEIHDLTPLELTPVESISENIQFVLETPQGWFARHNIGPGTLIRSERGALYDTFFKRKQ